MEDEILTVRETAKFLKVSESTVYRMAEAGEIPATKVKNLWRFQKAELRKWLTPKRR